jgi:hypothetical protein
LGYLLDTFSFAKFIGLLINCFLNKGDKKMYSIKKSLQKKCISAAVVALILFLSNITNALEIPLSYDFGEVPIGSSSTAFISISTSTTESYLSLWSTLENGEHYKIKTSIPPGGIPLPPGETVAIEIVFTPTTTQAVSDTLYIDASNPFIGSIREEIKLIGNETEISINNILTFFDTSVASGSIIGKQGGKANDNTFASSQKNIQSDKKGKSAGNRLNAFRNMLEEAGQLIDNDNIEDACGQLKSSYKKCDGNDSPPDFVEGYSAPEMAGMINELRVNLECN